MKIVPILAFAGLSFFATAAAATNFVSDGDFTSPGGGGSYTPYASGTLMGPWSVTSPCCSPTSDAIDLIGGYWDAPTSGTGSVDLDGTSPGMISQSFSLAPGNYVLTFDLSGNPDGGAGVKSLAVSIDGITDDLSYTVTGANNHGNMLYQLETIDFSVATAGTVTLSFESMDASTSPFGPVIGDVSVTAVPEPAAWGLMILGLGGLGAALRGRRRLVTA